MSVEKNLLISLLKLTEKRPIKQKQINIELKLPLTKTSTLLEKLQKDHLVYFKEDTIDVDAEFRLKIAVKAIQLGADVEHVSNYLSWQEFEAMAALALEQNGYVVRKNMRFKHSNRRWEIDVVGYRKPLVVCVDCKHWKRGMHISVLRKMVTSQTERAAAFADSLPNISSNLECLKWSRAKFVPVLLSLLPYRTKFCDKVPVVPVLKLQDFINQLPLNIESLQYFSREFSHL